ncbi:hypothetical protein ECB98_23805 [Brucellaceae bacterium VT-16-1752]|nr:hypothetical protein ECB98_23805 [Brucellaceae bacterium VT-16-1752]
MGGLFEWHSDKGWSDVPGSKEISGPNGVIATADGSKLYVAAWSGKQIVEIDRTTGKLAATDVDFFPDNLNWAANKATILATGIGGSSIEVALDCFSSSKVNCPKTGIRVDRFDPATKTRRTLVSVDGYGIFGAATGTIEVGKELWINSFRSDRIAILALP